MVSKTFIAAFALVLTATVSGATAQINDPFLAPTLPVPLEGQGPVTVTLEVDATGFPVADLAGTVSCTVTVFEGATVANVLDRASLDGCIDGWTATYYASTLDYGRFVTGVNGWQADCNTWPTMLAGETLLCTYWTYDVNGESAPAGVDGQTVNEEDVYTFTYEGVDSTLIP